MIEFDLQPGYTKNIGKGGNVELETVNLSGLYFKNFGKVGFPVPEILLDRFQKEKPRKGNVQEVADIEPKTGQDKPSPVLVLGPEKPPLDGFDFKNAFGDSFLMPVKMKLPDDANWYQLPFEPMVSLRPRKLFVETVLSQGKQKPRRSAVVEDIGFQGYSINIEGVCYMPYGGYPEADVRQIRRLLEYRGPVMIRCYMTYLFDIELMYITQGDVDRKAGMSIREQPFTIAGHSDEDFEYELNNP